MTTPNISTPPRRRLLAGLPGFAAATVGLIGISGWLLTIAFHGPGDSSAIGLSAVVAAVVQIGAFPAVRRLAAKNPMIGWASGALVRFISLPVYALLVTTAMSLPAAAALISLFLFYFLSMMVEPYFLRT